jgi:large subunit ribosomal protein L24
VSLGADRIAVERLRTEFERGTLEGRLAYSWSAPDRPAKLDADLSAAELDVDAVLAFAESALSGVGLEPPGEVALGLSIGKARIAGFEARNAAARLKFDAGGIAIERLTVADFGNAAIEARGRIETSSSPGGNISIDLDARELNGIIALTERFAPALADPIRQLAGRRKTAKLRATVSLENAAPDSATGKLALAGTIGAVRLDLTADASGKSDAFVVTDLSALSATDMRMNARLEAEDGGVLLSLVGLDRFGSDSRPGRLNVTASGPLNGALRLDAKLAAGPIDADVKGLFQRPAGKPAELRLDQLVGSIAGSKLQGKLVVGFAETPRVEGAIEVDALDAQSVVAAAIGLPASRAKTGDAGVWSLEPFVASASSLAGRIEFKTQQAKLAPALTVRPVRGVLRFSPAEVVFEDIVGDLGKGRLDARLAFATNAAGLSARGRVTLSGADAAAVIFADGRSPVAGRLAFEAEIEGVGLSPAAFIGALSGNGRVTLDGAQLTGLNPHVFDAVVRAVDLGIQIDANRIRDFVTSALDTASLPAARIVAPFTVSAGHARLGNVGTRAGGVDLEVTANVSLADAMLDALLTLRGVPTSSGAVRPAVLISLRGPVGAPRRAIDANALTGWLAMRAVEQQSKRLESMERLRREATEQPPAAAQRELPPASDAKVDPPPAANASPAAPSVAPATETTNTVPATDQVPPLPPPVTIVPMPRPRAEITPPRPAQPKPAALPPQFRPLDLIGAQ